MFAILFSLIIFLLIYILISPLFYWRIRDVPYIRGWPLIGSLLSMLTFKQSAGCLFESMYNHPNAKGQPFIGFFAFYKPAILLRDPQLIKRIFIKDFNYFSDHYSYTSPKVDPLGSRVLFFIRGEIWKSLRVALTPIFTGKRMREMFTLVDDGGKNVAKYLKNVTKNNRKEEIREIIARCTTDIIVSCAFGVDCNSLEHPESEFRNFGRGLFSYNYIKTLQVQSIFLGPDYFTTLFRSAFFNEEIQKFFRELFWDVMNEREKSQVYRPDLVGLLMEFRNKLKKDSSQMKKFDYNGDDLLAQSLMFFAAGFETTSTSISFALYELAYAPLIQFRVRKDILSAIKKHGGINYEALADMLYLDQVIQETLRLYPPLSILDRVVTKDYKIPDTNIVLKKGTPVYLSLRGLQKDPEQFKNPKRFDPDRFSEDGKKQWDSFAYLPFGEGPRACIGARFAYMVMKTVLSHILSTIELKPMESKKEEMEFSKFAFFTQSKKGLYLKTNLINISEYE